MLDVRCTTREDLNFCFLVVLATLGFTQSQLERVVAECLWTRDLGSTLKLTDNMALDVSGFCPIKLHNAF